MSQSASSLPSAIARPSGSFSLFASSAAVTAAVTPLSSQLPTSLMRWRLSPAPRSSPTSLATADGSEPSSFESSSYLDSSMSLSSSGGPTVEKNASAAAFFASAPFSLRFGGSSPSTGVVAPPASSSFCNSASSAGVSDRDVGAAFFAASAGAASSAGASAAAGASASSAGASASAGAASSGSSATPSAEISSTIFWSDDTLRPPSFLYSQREPLLFFFTVHVQPKLVSTARFSSAVDALDSARAQAGSAA